MTDSKKSLFLAALALAAVITACDAPDRVQPSETMAEASNDSAAEHIKKHLDPKYVRQGTHRQCAW